jgi:DNA-binding LytR/AlgR family response regulator
MIRAVVVEDEPLALEYLCALLAGTRKVEVVGQAGDGRAGLRLCEQCRPDAAFLDIRIPGPDGLSLAGRLLALPGPPLVVFVTGYAGHAVEAFRVEAIDYLLKPIEPDQVLDAVRRLEYRLAAASPAALPPDVAGTRLPVRGEDDDFVRLLPRGDILAAVRRARRTWVHTAAESFPTYYTLANLAKWLGGPPFEQVARDAVVNMTAVAEVLRTGDRLYRLRLRDHGGTVVDVSRSGAARVAAYLQPPS